MLPSLSDTIKLSSSPVYSESNTHPSSESTTLCSLSLFMKGIYPKLPKTNISLTSHHIFADLNVKTTQQEEIEFSPVIGRNFVLKPVSVWLCFPIQRKQSPWNKGLVPQAVWAQTQGTRASFRGMECVNLSDVTYYSLFDLRCYIWAPWDPVWLTEKEHFY